MRVPLWKHGEVCAYALVDGADAQIVAQAPRWHLHTTGHAMVKRDHNVYLHREIMGLGRGDSRQVDHINGDRLDNRRSNLRVVTNAQNGQNRHGYKNNTSGYRGVTWSKPARRWQAQFMLRGKNHYVGLFDDPGEAAEAVSHARAKAMPFAR